MHVVTTKGDSHTVTIVQRNAWSDLPSPSLSMNFHTLNASVVEPRRRTLALQRRSVFQAIEASRVDS